MSFGGGDLDAKLTLDPSQYNRNLDTAKAKAGGLDRALNKVGNSFGNTFIKFFTAGAIISAVRGAITSAVSYAQSVEKIGEEYRLSNEEAQALYQESERLGISIDEIVKRAGGISAALVDAKKGMGNILSDDDLKAIREFHAKMADIKAWSQVVTGKLLANDKEAWRTMGKIATFNLTRPMDGGLTSWIYGMIKGDDGKSPPKTKKKADDGAEKRERQARFEEGLLLEVLEAEEKADFAALTNAEKRARFEEKIRAGKEWLKQHWVNPDNEAGLTIRQGIAEAQIGLEGVPEDKVKVDFPKVTATTDALSSIGNFLGGGGGSSIANRQLTELQQIRQAVQKLGQPGGISPFPL